MTFNLNALVRGNIKNLTPYSSARKEFAGAARVFLDANENSFGSPVERNFNRYPDPQQTQIKRVVADRQGVSENEIFVSNGSDEAIDLLFRVFCEPKIDEVIITPPTYGMYEVSANINDVFVNRVLLEADFQISSDKILRQVDGERTKLIFLCSPNNPSGNSFNREAILEILENFGGIVAVDEAYIHFSKEKSFVGEIKNYPHLVVLQTFSKAWGLAGLRVGLAFARAEITELLNRVKPPYNVSQIAQEILLAALKEKDKMRRVAAKIVKERERLANELQKFSFVERVFPSDANFLLVKMTDANAIYHYLLEQKIVVRNRSNIELCANCLRITTGTPEENKILLSVLKNYFPK